MRCFRGNIVFPEICYTEPGRYVYTIRETTACRRCWITDCRAYRVVVTVKDDNGNLTASVKYLNGFPKFINRYCPPKCRCRW